MSRFSRKNRTDIQYLGCGGITDAFDDMMKQMHRINDDEYDYIIQSSTDEELNGFLPDFNTISEKRKTINFVNRKLEEYNKDNT